MNYKGMYSTKKLTDEILKKFDLEDDPTTRRRLNKKLTFICENIPAVKNGSSTDLWKKTNILFKGRKKAEHIFDETEKNVVLNHPELKAYIFKNIYDEKDERRVHFEQEEQKAKQEEHKAKNELKELQKAAGEINKRNLELENLPEASDIFTDEEYANILEEQAENEYVDPDFYSREEAHQEKMFMMIEALFIKHFTPIDEELLWKDMNVMPLLSSTNTDFTAEQMRAIKRYENKDYYKPLDKNDK